MEYQYVNTAELAKAAIAYSTEHGVSREEGLEVIMRRIEMTFPNYLTVEEQMTRRTTLFKCVLSLIPTFEPDANNVNSSGERRCSWTIPNAQQ